MGDNKNIQDYRDDAKIAMDELSYWSRKWNVKHKEIVDAIQATGSHAVSTIEQYLIDTGAIK